MKVYLYWNNRKKVVFIHKINFTKSEATEKIYYWNYCQTKLAVLEVIRLVISGSKLKKVLVNSEGTYHNDKSIIMK